MWPLLKISETFFIPTYFVYLSILYSFLIIYSYRRAGSKNFSIDITLNLILVIMLAGFVGARAFHVFLEERSYYFEDWTRVFQFWQGGFVFYGGALFATAAALVYLKIIHQPFLPWFHFFTPIGSLGYALGRFSCFLSGCCYGQICNLPWAVGGRHPTQLYAAFWELGVYFSLIFLEKRKFKNIFFIWIIFHALGRLIMEHFRADFRSFFWLGLSLSSWISLFLLSLGFSWLIKEKLLKS